MKRVYKNLFKRVLSLIMTVVLLSPFVAIYPSITIKADEAMQIKIHYHRFDENYEGWNLWVWSEGKDGASYEFNEEDEYGKVAEFELNVSDDSTRMGFIVRLNDWEAKDVDSDRYVEYSMAKDNVLEIYIVQGFGTIYNDPSEIDLSPRLVSASLDQINRISIETTKPFELKESKGLFTLTDESGAKAEVKAVTVAGEVSEYVTKAIVIFEEPLQIGKKYTLSMKGYSDMPVIMGGVFSEEEFESEYTYTGDDLGAVYSKEHTKFRVWAPTADAVNLKLYEKGNGGDVLETIPMTKDVNGTWASVVNGDKVGIYYNYEVEINGEKNEATDPYAKAVGVNGMRGMVVDLSKTNPDKWSSDKKPKFENFADAIIYETHIRDMSISESSGIVNKGKYKGLTEVGTKNSEGLSTGISHIKEMGITHLHILPSFDYQSIDETALEENVFNWGYDPQNYNVPEGSYSSDPYNGEIRIKEYKEMVQALHENGIRVVMDVVYNHTGKTADSNLNILVPFYYYRMKDGAFSNGSGCGNETASERAMVRKLIVDSVVYWAKEYHIDGFRFDLMGLHDIETMNEVRKALNEIDPTILLYGEGWTGGATPLWESESALKANTYKLDNIAAFNDDIRDGIKGHVFTATEKGFATGEEGLEERVKFGIVGAVFHNQIDYTKVGSSKKPWATNPIQSINYVSAHDNLTLWDKIEISNPEDSIEDRIRMDKFSNSIVFTSQGIPFMLAGEEFLRTKGGDENSYKSPDSVNAINWNLKTENKDVYEYYKGLIAFRKSHNGFRMNTGEEVDKYIKFFDNVSDNVIAYEISAKEVGDKADKIIVIHNANRTEESVKIPDGKWNIYINGEKAGTSVIETVSGGEINVSGISTTVLVMENGFNVLVLSLIFATIIVFIIVGLVSRYIIKKSKIKNNIR